MKNEKREKKEGKVPPNGTKVKGKKPSDLRYKAEFRWMANADRRVKRALKQRERARVKRLRWAARNGVLGESTWVRKEVKRIRNLPQSEISLEIN